MCDKNNLVTYESINDLMIFKWKDGLESYVNLKTIREKCPCATCAGEKDVFGNIYKGTNIPMSENSFQLKGLQPVGYYALRPYWEDGHHSGIYSFEMLRTLCENLSGE
jgi:DUF971 family protein|tara:strand:+ start:69 stop:392 length:324 start_codon:yes stop_codon:yes gene_type:complete